MSGRPPARPPKPVPRKPLSGAPGRGPGARHPVPKSSNPGCLASLFLDLTGIGFLVGMKRKLGGPLFALAFFGLLGIMFVAGLKIERYGHLGEAQYIWQILPMASCFSPVLALLMSIVFGIGDVLTNATYWIFPQDSVFNLYHLFRQPKPLLTWGAYARMDFITLPLYAVLPGLGSRVAYGIASRIFQAGRAKIMRDGGTPPGGDDALKRQLNQALQEQQAAARRESAASGQFDKADAAAEGSADNLRMAEVRQGTAAAHLDAANTQTARANQESGAAQEALREAEAQARMAGAKTREAEKEKAAAADGRDRADAELRQGSLREEDLAAGQEKNQAQQKQTDLEVKESRKTLDKLAADRAEIEQALKDGVDSEGRPMTPERAARAKEVLDQNIRTEAAERMKLEVNQEQKRELERKAAKLKEDLRVQKEENERDLRRYRDADEKARKAEAEATAAREKEESLRERVRAKEAEVEESRRRAEESRQQAEEEKSRLDALGREKAAAEREWKVAADQRNATAQQLNGARRDLGTANDRVNQLQTALGLGPSAPVGPSDPGAGRRRHKPDPARDAILEYDRAMYAAMEERRRWREQLIRDWQVRNRGELPSGLGPADLGGGGFLGGQSLAALAAAAAGGVAGSALGAGLFHGHMWAEYNPIREIVHPSHTRDVGCFKMDVGYLDTNMAGGVSNAGVMGPAGVLGAGVAGATGGGAPPPPLPPSGPSGETPEERAARDAAQKARDEADRIRKQWEESEQSADKSDPNYAKLKKEYDDYIASQDGKADEADAEAKQIQDEREAKAREEQEARERKEEWIRNRQDDLRAAAEEKAHLVAVMAGAAGAGLNTSEHQVRLNQLNERLGQLHGDLQKEGGDIDYTARDRGVIKPGKDFLEAPAKMKAQQELLTSLQKMRKAAWDHGMLEPGADGKRGDIYGKMDRIIGDLLSGKKLDPDEIAKVREHIGHRIDGTSGDPSRPPPPERPWYADGESWKQALGETGRNISTCQTSDGKMSWSGLAGRVGIGLLTMGGSEWVFTPAAGLYVTKDAVDRGADGFEAWKEGMTETIKQEIIGKAVGGLFTVGGRAIGGMAGAEIAGQNMFKGAAKGAWTGLREVGEGAAKEAGELFSGQAWKRTASELGEAIGGGAKRAGNLLTGQEGLETGFGKGAQEGAEAAGTKGPLIGTPEWAKQQQVRRAAATGDPDVVAGLYRDGGMKDLIDMQKKGLIKADEAKAINRILQTQVNESIHEGTQSTINQFHGQTGVRVNDVMVGDSGSSAAGPPTRLKTDADRTLVPRFNEYDLDRYAHKNNMSTEQAYDELCQKFKDSHEANVSSELQNRGFGNTGNLNPEHAADNVGYGSYDRIGGGSGKSDSYAEGFTNARQAGQGKGTCYTADADGNVAGSHSVSGQTVVDQNQLNKWKYDPDYKIPDDPTRIPPSEIPSVLNQQNKSIASHPDDPLTIAKAVGRTEKIAATAGESLGDPRLTQTAREIYENPGRMNEILKQNGYVDARGNPDPSAFCAQGGGAVGDYSETFRGIRPSKEPPKF